MTTTPASEMPPPTCAQRRSASPRPVPEPYQSVRQDAEELAQAGLGLGSVIVGTEEPRENVAPRATNGTQTQRSRQIALGGLPPTRPVDDQVAQDHEAREQ